MKIFPKVLWLWCQMCGEIIIVRAPIDPERLKHQWVVGCNDCREEGEQWFSRLLRETSEAP